MNPSRGDEPLPALGENATALAVGFYDGFIAWVGLQPPHSDRGETAPDNGWYYAGYLAGWVAKLTLFVGLGEVVVPFTVDAAGGTGAQYLVLRN